MCPKNTKDKECVDVDTVIDLCEGLVSYLAPPSADNVKKEFSSAHQDNSTTPIDDKLVVVGDELKPKPKLKCDEQSDVPITISKDRSSKEDKKTIASSGKAAGGGASVPDGSTMDKRMEDDVSQINKSFTNVIQHSHATKSSLSDNAKRSKPNEDEFIDDFDRFLDEVEEDIQIEESVASLGSSPHSSVANKTAEENDNEPSVVDDVQSLDSVTDENEDGDVHSFNNEGSIPKNQVQNEKSPDNDASLPSRVEPIPALLQCVNDTSPSSRNIDRIPVGGEEVNAPNDQACSLKIQKDKEYVDVDSVVDLCEGLVSYLAPPSADNVKIEFSSAYQDSSSTPIDNKLVVVGDELKPKLQCDEQSDVHITISKDRSSKEDNKTIASSGKAAGGGASVPDGSTMDKRMEDDVSQINKSFTNVIQQSHATKSSLSDNAKRSKPMWMSSLTTLIVFLDEVEEDIQIEESVASLGSNPHSSVANKIAEENYNEPSVVDDVQSLDSVTDENEDGDVHNFNNEGSIPKNQVQNEKGPDNDASLPSRVEPLPELLQCVNDTSPSSRNIDSLLVDAEERRTRLLGSFYDLAPPSVDDVRKEEISSAHQDSSFTSIDDKSVLACGDEQYTVQITISKDRSSDEDKKTIVSSETAGGGASVPDDPTKDRRMEVDVSQINKLSTNVKRSKPSEDEFIDDFDRFLDEVEEDIQIEESVASLGSSPHSSLAKKTAEENDNEPSVVDDVESLDESITWVSDIASEGSLLSSCTEEVAAINDGALEVISEIDEDPDSWGALEDFERFRNHETCLLGSFASNEEEDRLSDEGRRTQNEQSIAAVVNISEYLFQRELFGALTAAICDTNEDNVSKDQTDVCVSSPDNGNASRTKMVCTRMLRIQRPR
ncbi:hypothetical protein OS493_021181 [Desmophyllum pertusum]|uniref:Uncharacterized protein n=1 Tax=Desmophyllum pertusum TaxID=174260 RepID=A0A9W9ZNG9_9CNID|nr:hypothetical protein OS493_021181 [Desmophyllum pertusum]